MTAVRCDRVARPNYQALPSEVRAEIEAAIPDGCYLTITSAFASGHDYHARVFLGRQLIGESRIVRYVEDAAREAIRRSVIGVEERAGYLVEPLDNAGDLNREGDPAWNGAFDRW